MTEDVGDRGAPVFLPVNKVENRSNHDEGGFVFSAVAFFPLKELNNVVNDASFIENDSC